MKKLLISLMLVIPAVASAQQIDAFGRPIQSNNLFGQPQQTAPDPVRIQMQQQPGGWIHTPAQDPVLHQMREQSWIHTKAKDPVKHQMQQQPGGWIHGSIHDE